GNAKPMVSTKAPRNPSTPANTTVQTSAVAAMPARQMSIDAPQAMSGQARRSSLPATAGHTKEAGTRPKMTAGSASQVQAGRASEVTGQEGVGGEIGTVDAAEQDAALPDQLVAPIRPPLETCGRRAR